MLLHVSSLSEQFVSLHLIVFSHALIELSSNVEWTCGSIEQAEVGDEHRGKPLGNGQLANNSYESRKLI